MKIITIKGKEYPYKMTLGACKKFKAKFGVDVLAIDGLDIEHNQYILLYGLESGAKLEGKELDITIDTLDELDIDELQEALVKAQESTGDAEKGKKK